MATNVAKDEADPAPRVISLRLKPTEAEKLKRLARLLRRSVSSTASLLLEEKLREGEFTYVEFKDSSLGRQAYLRGRRLSVWEVCWIAQRFENKPSAVAEHLQWPLELVASALSYAGAYPEEIEPLVAEANSLTLSDLKRKLPGLQAIEV
ncbi:MAG: transcriptional regulator [Actinomycetota bacterium]